MEKKHAHTTVQFLTLFYCSKISLIGRGGGLSDLMSGNVYMGDYDLYVTRLVGECFQKSVSNSEVKKYNERKRAQDIEN